MEGEHHQRDGRRRRKIPKDFDQLTRRAKEGDPKAAYRLGKLLLLERDVSVKEYIGSDSRTQLGLKYIEEAARTLPDAMCELGRYLQGKNKLRKGFSWYRKAALAGNVDGMYGYAMGLSKKDQLDEKLEYLRKAEKERHYRATAELGIIYLTGQGVTKDESKGIDLLRSAVSRGYKEEHLKRKLRKRGLDIEIDKRHSRKRNRKIPRRTVEGGQRVLIPTSSTTSFRAERIEKKRRPDGYRHTKPSKNDWTDSDLNKLKRGVLRVQELRTRLDLYPKDWENIAKTEFTMSGKTFSELRNKWEELQMQEEDNAMAKNLSASLTNYQLNVSETAGSSFKSSKTGAKSDERSWTLAPGNNYSPSLINKDKKDGNLKSRIEYLSENLSEYINTLQKKSSTWDKVYVKLLEVWNRLDKRCESIIIEWNQKFGATSSSIQRFLISVLDAAMDDQKDFPLPTNVKNCMKDWKRIKWMSWGLIGLHPMLCKMENNISSALDELKSHVEDQEKQLESQLENIKQRLKINMNKHDRQRKRLHECNRKYKEPLEEYLQKCFDLGFEREEGLKRIAIYEDRDESSRPSGLVELLALKTKIKDWKTRIGKTDNEVCDLKTRKLAIEKESTESQKRFDSFLKVAENLIPDHGASEKVQKLVDKLFRAGQNVTIMKIENKRTFLRHRKGLIKSINAKKAIVCVEDTMNMGTSSECEVSLADLCVVGAGRKDFLSFPLPSSLIAATADSMPPAHNL
mmetsp:Transcript_20358/g.30460  ORF Transcript_20358/g.30460 Transcript_20358/m.30460 type:complete len:740 (-) Transcript_20358:300-2519(-)